MKRFDWRWCVLVFLLAIGVTGCVCLTFGVASLLTGCATEPQRGPFPLKSDPAPVFAKTFLDCWWLAEIEAYQEGGHVYEMEPTGSMVPTLLAKDLVVIVPKPFAEFVPFRIALYDADWLPVSSPDCIHRIVGRDEKGLIMWGDANPFAESAYRVTEGKAKGILVGIWRVGP